MQGQITGSRVWAAAGQGILPHGLSGMAMLLLALCTTLSSTAALADKPAAIYAGRERPKPVEEPRPYYRVLNQSSGYGAPGYGRGQPNVNVQFGYQAPSTTVINNSVQIIPPGTPTGNISYSQDTYYINTVPVYPQRHRRHINPATQLEEEEPLQPMQDRAKQWTNDVGITP